MDLILCRSVLRKIKAYSIQVLQNCISEKEKNINYYHLKGTITQQYDFISLYEKLLEIRDELLAESSEPSSSLPGLYTGPMHSEAKN